MPVPPSGEWSGEFQDMPCIADEEHAVKYELTFKANGAIQGTCESAEGDFNINVSTTCALALLHGLNFRATQDQMPKELNSMEMYHLKHMAPPGLQGRSLHPLDAIV